MSSPLAEAQAAARDLLGCAIDAVEPCRGGGNNRVYRVRANGVSYALKAYPRSPGDPRDRLRHEFDGLRFLGAHGVPAVPRALAADRTRGVALYEWVEGAHVTGHDAGDVAQALALLARLDALRGEPEAAALPPAAEAVLHPAELDEQIERRLARLDATPGEPALHALLAELRGTWRQLRVQDEPPVARRTLSPSDFGFHNALRTPAGELVFLDFEYFGWDDPVKLVCDVLWHPGMALADDERAAFRTGAASVWGDDARWEQRLRRDLPRYGLRWALIVLNEFLPAAWERRVAAGRPDSWASAKQQQLVKARRLLEEVRVLSDIS